MVRRRAIKGILDNFLGTYTSRYTDYDGYWLFGMLIKELEAIDIDLLHLEENSPAISSRHAAKILAVGKFFEQIQKAGIPISFVQAAKLSIMKMPSLKKGPVNGHICDGFDLRFVVNSVSDLGKTYESIKFVFVAPHDPRIEQRSNRCTLLES